MNENHDVGGDRLRPFENRQMQTSQQQQQLLEGSGALQASNNNNKGNVFNAIGADNMMDGISGRKDEDIDTPNAEVSPLPTNNDGVGQGGLNGDGGSPTMDMDDLTKLGKDEDTGGGGD